MMARVKWKGPVFYKNLILSNNKIKIVPRFLEISLNFIGKNFLVHNGKKLIKLKIYSNMIGYKFGAFVFTKIIPFFKK